MIELEGVTREYGGVAAVKDVTLHVDRGETLCLIGTSGCGKTTTLKMINRLVEPTRGRILVHGQDAAAVDPIALRRGIGYVIQKIGLFPHRTVAENVALLPTLEGWSSDRVRGRTEELLALVGLDPAVFGPRYPGQLSGGQQQRVGVARALALDPPIILLDEPFGALDPITRGLLQDEFLGLQRAFAKTILIVTHDLNEAFKLGDRVALMAHGELVQVGTEAEFRAFPATPFVAEFLKTHLSRATLASLPALAALDPRAVAENGAPTLEAGASLKQAVDLFLRHPQAAAIRLVDADGRTVGALSRDSVLSQV